VPGRRYKKIIIRHLNLAAKFCPAPKEREESVFSTGEKFTSSLAGNFHLIGVFALFLAVTLRKHFSPCRALKFNQKNFSHQFIINVTSRAAAPPPSVSEILSFPAIPPAGNNNNPQRSTIRTHSKAAAAKDEPPIKQSLTDGNYTQSQVHVGKGSHVIFRHRIMEKACLSASDPITKTMPASVSASEMHLFRLVLRR